jgi:hypothetical protein
MFHFTRTTCVQCAFQLPHLDKFFFYMVAIHFSIHPTKKMDNNEQKRIEMGKEI